MNRIIPSIISKSSQEFEKMIRIIEPYTDRVHLDVMDGIFVSGKTISYHEEIAKINTPLDFDVHLMVDDPKKQISFWLQTKADRFILQIESQSDLSELINLIHLNNKKAGIALNPDTSVDAISKSPVFNSYDFVQFMTVNPGQYGSEFKDEVISKIESFHNKYPEISIEVDGGVNLQTISKLLAVGVSAFVVGSYIFYSKDVGKAIEELKKVGQNT